MKNIHFIELMIIPLLIVGALLYADNFDRIQITGYAVSVPQPAQSPVLGTYSINPNFKASFDYDIKGKFSEIKSTMNSMIELCKEDPNTETCLNERISALGWKCTKNDEESILHDFTDKIKECISTDGKSLCKFNFDDKEGINDKALIREFQIKLAAENARTKAQLFERDKLLATDYLNIEELRYADYEGRETGKAADTIEMTLTYSIGNPSIKEVFATSSNSRVELSKKIIMYKSNEIKFIDETEENLFESPIKTIFLPRYKGMKLCVDTGKQIYAYDASDNSVKMRDLVYRFAVTFTTPPPGPLTGVRSLKIPNDAQIVEWDKMENVASYSIYYSKVDFIDFKLSEMRSDKDIIHISVSPEPYEEFDFFAGMKFEKGKLYYHTGLNKFYYVIDVEDNTPYYAAVAAVNEQGSEIFNDHSVPNSFVYENGKNYVEFTSGTDSQ